MDNAHKRNVQVPSPTQLPLSARGGLTLNGWLLAAPIRSFTSKRTGKPVTVIELRDPAALSHSCTIFLPGEADELSQAAPSTAVDLVLTSARAGKANNELIGSAARTAVQAAFGAAGGRS